MISIYPYLTRWNLQGYEPGCLVTQNHDHIRTSLSLSFCELGILEQLSWHLWLRDSHEVAVKMSVRATVSLRLECDGESASKVAHPHAGAGCCWEASVSSHIHLFTELLECPHKLASVFPQSE